MVAATVIAIKGLGNPSPVHMDTPRPIPIKSSAQYSKEAVLE